MIKKQPFYGEKWQFLLKTAFLNAKKACHPEPVEEGLVEVWHAIHQIVALR